MDFSALNPDSTNSLNIAARHNNVLEVKRLLERINPNCVDNRGWTCLHEAAANDSYDSLILITKHPDCRLLAETYEGHTALYLACREKCSMKTIKFLLENVEDIANYASTEMVTPLHVVCSQGRLELIQLLLDYGAIIGIKDYDEDTPLHIAAFEEQPEVVKVLLHAGAEAELKNMAGFTPFHLACMKGCFESVKLIMPFISNIDDVTCEGDTPLIIATQQGLSEIVQYLLENSANPDIFNNHSDLAIKLSVTYGHADIFKMLLAVTEKDYVRRDLMLYVCKPHYFNMEVLIALLESDLGPEFFDVYEEFYIRLEKICNMRPHYDYNAPLNCFLQNCEYIYDKSPDLLRQLLYLYLMRGVSVDAYNIDECPPLVYMHFCEHFKSYEEVIEILAEQGCNIDYRSTIPMPDILLVSMGTGAITLPKLLQYSLYGEPASLLHFLSVNNLLPRTHVDVQKKLFIMAEVCSDLTNFSSENILNLTPTLKQLCRLKVRECLRNTGINTTNRFLQILYTLPLPPRLKAYLRYL